MKLIGFANKYYTLWEYTSNVITGSDHRKTKVENFRYIKNISMDREKAFGQYPGVDFDENLKGKSESFSTSSFAGWEHTDKFRFGKYEGGTIEIVDDVNYTEWYYRQVNNNDEHTEVLINYLKKYGYEFEKITMLDGGTRWIMFTPEEAEYRHQERERIAEFDTLCKTGAPLEFTPDHNIDEYGEYNDNGIKYAFPEYKDMYYNGYTYFVPLKNGKVKRIKNKTVVVTEYEWNAENRTVTVKEFEIR